MNLVEIFSSVQGEGPHVGATTLFVRFGECDLRCAWCDSPGTWRPARRCRVETAPGSGAFRVLDNPVALADLEAACEGLGVARHAFVSLTGGEPLLQPDALRDVARALRARGPRIYLETHGLACEALSRVLPDVDVVSMDWKLASDVRRAAEPREEAPRAFHGEHERFLRLARRGAETFVKVVVSEATRDEELEAMCRHIASVDDATLLVIQPVTPQGRVTTTPGARQLLAWLAQCREQLSEVRLIPQTHRMYGAL